MAVERVLSNLNLISFKTEGGLQNHIDELQDGDLVFTPDNSLKGNLFDFKWTDHKLNDISWLNADTFSWQSGDVYVAAFEHLVNDYISLSGKGVLYAYYAEDAGETFYLRTDTPSVGDQLLDETGTPAYEAYGEHKVKEIYDDGSFARTATFPGNRFYRDASKDVTLSAPQSETETISGITIRYYKADDGHKICMQDQEANVQALYEATGVAWYYIINMISKQFKLPRTKFGFTGLRDSVGGYVPAGLPNITGAFHHNDLFSGTATASGAFGTTVAPNSDYAGATKTTRTTARWDFDASRSSSVYGNSDTVQPKATQMYLYFYVGNFERDALEQTAGITSEQLNNKADTTYVDEQLATKADTTYVNEQLGTKANTDLSNIPSAYDYVVKTYKSGTTWYRKYKSGWVEQGGYDTGTVGSGANDSSETYTLLVPMQDSNYALTLGYGYGNIGGQSGKFGITAKTATNFTFRVISLAGNATGKYLSWQVSGYAA